jgi:hypothetical protein
LDEKLGEGDNGWKVFPKKRESKKKQKLDSKPKVEHKNARGESVRGHSGSGCKLGMVSILDTMSHGLYHDQLRLRQDLMVGARIVDVGALTMDGDAFHGDSKIFEYEESSEGKIDSLSGVDTAAEMGTKIHCGEKQNNQARKVHDGFLSDMECVDCSK